MSPIEKAIPTNLRLLIILEEFAKAGVPLTPTEVNEKIGLPKPTIHRLFSILEEEGFIQMDIDSRKYAPAPRLRALSSGILSSHRIRTARQSILKKLTRTIGETCNIAMPDRDEMVYIERVETHWPLRIQLPVGTRIPLYCAASGKLYLSTIRTNALMHYLASTDLSNRALNTISNPDSLTFELKQIRKQGYAADNQEFMTGMIALAVPILDTNGRMMATLSFHAPLVRVSLEKALTYLEPLQTAARDIAELVEH